MGYGTAVAGDGWGRWRHGVVVDVAVWVDVRTGGAGYAMAADLAVPYHPHPPINRFSEHLQPSGPPTPAAARLGLTLRQLRYRMLKLGLN
jgi:hypothetical protein